MNENAMLALIDLTFLGNINITPLGNTSESLYYITLLDPLDNEVIEGVTGHNLATTIISLRDQALANIS